MYLTDKKNEANRALDDHEDLELLLESFAKQVEEIVNEADTMIVSKSISSFQTQQSQHSLPSYRLRVTYNPLKK